MAITRGDLQILVGGMGLVGLGAHATALTVTFFHPRLPGA